MCNKFNFVKIYAVRTAKKLRTAKKKSEQLKKFNL